MKAQYVLCAQSSAGRPQRGELDVVQSVVDAGLRRCSMASFGEGAILRAKKLSAIKCDRVVNIAVKTALRKEFGGVEHGDC